MSSTVTSMETIEKNKIQLTIEIEPEEFKKGLQYVYNQNKNSFNIQGFRKGKAPRKIIEQQYGKDVFYERAFRHVLPDAYEKALEDKNIEPVYRPDIEVKSMDEATGVIFVATTYVKPEIEINDYYGITYPIKDTEPTEADIQEKLQAEREKNARTISVDRPAENGDIVSINFTGYIDDEPFEGGHGENYDLTLGTKTFIDTFEDQLLGHSVGDDIDVNVTFPENYGKEEFQNKPALFKVEILEIQAKELPEINDDFAQDVSEFETLEDFRQDVKNKIREEKEKEALVAKRAEVVSKLVDKAVMDIPEAMYEARVEEMLREMHYSLDQRGLSIDQYLQFTGMTMDALRENYKKPAKEDVEARLVLEAVAKKENFEISDEAIKEHLENHPYHGKNAEQIFDNLTQEGKKDLIKDMLMQKALDFVVEKAVAIEAV